MNKAITDGLVLMPPAFADGLTVWSREDGTPGSATYDGSVDAALVSSDQDFADCLELTKTETVQRLRYTGETPILPGLYLRITARVKALSGNLPTVRIAGWAGDASGDPVASVPATGPETTLTGYGQVVEVSAIVGTGTRTGVDMIWGSEPVYGHFGLDLTGPNGGIVRIDNLSVEDVTAVFHRKMMDWVDVRDYGAVGDGTTDDVVAFNAADAAAAGRQVLVPAGTYLLGNHMTFENRVRFEGQVSMADAHRLVLRKNFELNSYIDAFGDEVLAFKKAFQALLNFTDHESLDLSGRRIELTAPLDMQAIVGNKTNFEIRRVIRNGQFNAEPGAAWDTETVTSAASYSTSSPTRLTNVANAANVPVGARVSGTGVGREVYVRAVDVSAGEITLSQPLWGAPGNQTYTFERYQYILDFSGFSKLSKITLTDIDFQCGGHCSAVMLAPLGSVFMLKDCVFNAPKDRGVTSIGNGCQALHIDRCDFVSNESPLASTARVSVAFNVNANDAKIRDNRFNRFGTTGVLAGSGHLIVGNHWFQGDDLADSPRSAGMVMSQTNMKSVVTGNYIDNCFFEWTNEHDPDPDFASEFSFGGLSLTGNIFTTNDVADWFAWIVVKPHGTGHFLHGFNVTGNTFKSLNGSIQRIERVDSSIAPLDASRMRNVTFQANTFNGIDQPTINPVTLTFSQDTPAATWTLDVSGYLPFDGWARTVPSLVAEGDIRTASGAKVYPMPTVTPNAGANKNLVQLVWPEAVEGIVTLTARSDNPF